MLFTGLVILACISRCRSGRPGAVLRRRSRVRQAQLQRLPVPLAAVPVPHGRAHRPQLPAAVRGAGGGHAGRGHRLVPLPRVTDPLPHEMLDRPAAAWPWRWRWWWLVLTVPVHDSDEVDLAAAQAATATRARGGPGHAPAGGVDRRTSCWGWTPVVEHAHRLQQNASHKAQVHVDAYFSVACTLGEAALVRSLGRARAAVRGPARTSGETCPGPWRKPTTTPSLSDGPLARERGQLDGEWRHRRPGVRQLDAPAGGQPGQTSSPPRASPCCG